MRCRYFKILSTCAGFILSTALVAAATFSSSPAEDVTLYEDPAGTIANGAGQGLFAGRVNTTSGGKIRRAIVRFNLSAIPSSAVVTTVSLTLTSGQGNTPTQLGLYRATAAWGEGTSVASANGGGGTPAQPNDATWTKRFFATSQDWTTSGGDFLSTPSATVIMPALGTITFTGTTMVSEVQAWVSAPAQNFGWLILGDESTFGTAIRFDSREATTPATRPLITVVYNIPTAVESWRLY